nr:reverse transcriptase domain-containing protein [Tanacetum cinerariifolium]
MMSSPNHPTSNIEDAFSSNFLDYTMASPNYFPASPRNISPDPPYNLSKYLFASLAISPFHNVQTYNAVTNKPPIPPQDPITLPTILTPSPVLPPSPLFDPRHFFIPEELLPPKKQIHPPSSSSTMLSNSSQKQAAVGLIRWLKWTAMPIGVKEAYKITWYEFKRLLIKKYYPQTKIKKMEEAITMTQKLIEQVLKHNSVQETNDHKRKLEDRRNITNGNNNNYHNNNHRNDHHQQQNRRKETFKIYTATN